MLVCKHILSKVPYIKTEGRDPGLGSSVPNMQVAVLAGFQPPLPKPICMTVQDFHFVESGNNWEKFEFRNLKINSEHILHTGMELNRISDEIRRTLKGSS